MLKEFQMPAIQNSEYQRPKWCLNAHMETIYPALFRKVKNIPPFESQRITTPDQDFLDLFWSKQGSQKCVILQHGLEGSADRPYITGMAKCFFENGFDTLTWNYRGCGDEINRTELFYHSGATYDLDLVISHALPKYDEVYLVGFSLGGNLTLKYLGEAERNQKIKKAVAISAPLDLDAGVDHLHGKSGLIYEKRFLKNLRKKVISKHEVMPDKISIEHLKKVKTLRDFDDHYTAPIHGFDDAEHYYSECSSKFFLSGIQTKTLILNASNDPFLSQESLDANLTKDLPNVQLEITKHGGHVGFIDHQSKYYWSEQRALDFCMDSSD